MVKKNQEQLDQATLKKMSLHNQIFNYFFKSFKLLMSAHLPESSCFGIFDKQAADKLDLRSCSLPCYCCCCWTGRCCRYSRYLGHRFDLQVHYCCCCCCCCCCDYCCYYYCYYCCCCYCCCCSVADASGVSPMASMFLTTRYLCSPSPLSLVQTSSLYFDFDFDVENLRNEEVFRVTGRSDVLQTNRRRFQRSVIIFYG